MANIKISQLTAVGAANGTDELEVNQGGTSKKATVTQITAAEATTRANADTTLTNNLNTEITNRTNADTTLTNNLNTEITNRTNADALLVPKAGGTMTGPLIIDDTSIQIQEGADTLTITVPALSASRAVTFGDLAGAVVLDTATQTISSKTLTSPIINSSTINAATVTGIVDMTAAVLSGASPLVFEGTTADAFETTIAVTDPTADRTITLPDNTGTVALTNDITDFQQFVGLPEIINISAGTWTTTRIARANYVKRHTAAANTSIIGLDITPVIRTTASKGFKLTSMDFIYSIATDVLVAHTVTLDLVSYANGAAVTTAAIALTGSLSTATNANPYVTNIVPQAPPGAVFDTTADSKYVLEVTVQTNATTDYDFYGVMLRFTRNDF